MTAILRSIEIVFENNGAVRAARGRYVTLDAQGNDIAVGVKRETDALERIPAVVRSAAELAVITGERDDALADLAAARARIAELEAQIGSQTGQREPEPGAPREVSRADFRGALYQLGHLTAVNAAVASVGGLLEIMWQDATTFFENDRSLAAMAAQMGIDLATVFDAAEAIRDQRRNGAITGAANG